VPAHLRTRSAQPTSTYMHKSRRAEL